MKRSFEGIMRSYLCPRAYPPFQRRPFAECPQAPLPEEAFPVKAVTWGDSGVGSGLRRR